MPFYREIKTEEGWGGIWKVTETLNELCDELPHGEAYWIYVHKHFSSEKRQMEYVAVRLLIFYLLGEERQVAYYPSGKPYLSDHSMHLSISHTQGYVAVLFSQDNEVGLDIEMVSERVLRLKDRLLGMEEKAENTYEILLHWSSKETAFKILDEEGIDFRAHLQVTGLSCPLVEQPDTQGSFNLNYSLQSQKSGSFLVHYMTTTDFVLTYAFGLYSSSPL